MTAPDNHIDLYRRVVDPDGCRVRRGRVRRRDRKTFGRPLIENQVVRHKLVEMHRRVEAARVYTREVARRYDAGEQPLVEALHAKKLGVDSAAYCVDQAVQLHGGTGYMHGTEVERHYRDARILPIGGGATEVLTNLTARLMGYS